MKKLFFLLISLMMVNISSAQLPFSTYCVIAVDKKVSLDNLNGITYIGVIKNGKYKFKKLKEINPEMFDYAFAFFSGNFDAQYLHPLSSGKYDGKQPQFDVIKIDTKKSKNYKKFRDWRDKAFIVDYQKGLPNIYSRYKGQDIFYTSSGYTLLNTKVRKGIYYRFFDDRTSYINRNKDINWNSSTLDKSLHGYEILYDHEKGCFGIVSMNDGKKYWGVNAKDYLERHYLSSIIIQKEAEERLRAEKIRQEKEHPLGWAYFSDKGKGCVKFKMDISYGQNKAVIVFSGFNKNDNVIDEVFIIDSEKKGKIEKNPSVKPLMIDYLHSFYQQGVNFYFIQTKYFEEELVLVGSHKELQNVKKTDDLQVSKSIIEDINYQLNKSGKWKNKSDVKYYHRDRWGESHLM